MVQPSGWHTRPRDDDALIRRVAAGDDLAFDTLYETYAPRLMAYLQPRLGQPELAEEVCQDVLLVVWQKAAQFKPTSRLSTWIFGIAQRLAWKAYARTALQAAQLAPAPDDRIEGDDPEDILCRQANQRMVAQAVATLPPPLQQTITLRYYREYAYRDIATRMACTKDTVKRRLWQARRRLRALLNRSERTAMKPSDQHHRLSVTAITTTGPPAGQLRGND